MVASDQKPESKRMYNGPVPPALRTRATSSSMNRTAPRWVLAAPFRILACSTPPVNARVARIGW